MKRSLGSDVPSCQYESNQCELAEQKAERCRERNREHAKKTRLRKKEMIEGMKMRLMDLQRESARLEQMIEESNTASILLCLGGKQDLFSTFSSSSPLTKSPTAFCQSNLCSSSSSSSVGSAENKQEGEEEAMMTMDKGDAVGFVGFLDSLTNGNIIDQLRQKVRAEAAKNFPKDLNSLTSPDNGEDGEEESSIGLIVKSSSSLSPAPEEVDQELQNRRARNRMHAKLTRDRKKLLTNKMQETIRLLEHHNQRLKMQLDEMSLPSPSYYPNSTVQLNMQDPLSAFCYFAEIWNQENKHSSVLSNRIHCA